VAGSSDATVGSVGSCNMQVAISGCCCEDWWFVLELDLGRKEIRCRCRSFDRCDRVCVGEIVELGRGR